MKSFKNFNEAYSQTERGTHGGKPTKSWGMNIDALKRGVKDIADYLAPPASRSAEPTVRSGERTAKTGFDYVASRDEKGARYDKTGSPAPAKLDAGTRGTTMSSNPQYRGVGARSDTATKTKKTTKDSSNYSAADAAADQERAKAAANKSRLAKQTRDKSPRPQKPSPKNDSRNAEYVKKRAAANAATGDDKKKATKDAESAGMAAWRKANPKLAKAQAERKRTRGTSATTNPLMAKTFGKKYVQNKMPVPEPKPNKGTGRDGKFGTGTTGKGMPSNPPGQFTSRAPATKTKAPESKTPVTKAPEAPAPVKIKVEPYKVGDKVGYSKGGEVKKKTKKESFLGFGDYLVEKKTKIKLNPKKDDLLEGGSGKHSKVNKEDHAYVSQEEVSEEGYQEGYETETDLTTEASFDIGPGHRGAMKGKKIYDKGKGTTNPNEKDAFMKRTGPQLPLAKGKKSLETAGYEPEGDQIDEALPGSIEAKKGSTYDSKKDFKTAFKANPGAFKSALPSSGARPGGMMPAGRPGLYTGSAAFKPMSAFQQKMAFKGPLGAALGGNRSGKGFWKATMKANNASIASNKPTSSGPKPNPMQANRPGFSNTGAKAPSVNKPPSPSSSPNSGGPKPIKKVPNPLKKPGSGKKPGQIDWDKFNESSTLRSFGVINSLSEDKAEDAKKSLERVKKRQGVLDDYEKKTGKKLDINKSVEAREHQKNFPGAKRTGKKKRGEKESELETHNRRVNKYTERLLKHGKTKKQKKNDDAMAKHASRFD